MTPGEIAKTVASTPSAASYHLERLQRAGLIVRERSGQYVLVHRTPRGAELLRLFGET